ncbi:sugar phosphate isomerase/epimerase family protein [Lederbergia lenta]|uniref:Xylose isomerase n=1 Tax=Lederbergia lenta TaxID=1467 RepID=A0A2X4YQ60_LEDLE|nr:sugar phosphate isomerase/epimerase [Lederbergia lenta]MCM3110853.1 sugar phosphate isomerase/epimerase [Lederbergia lenta]MEC2325752.1 sugar phosphate isomerase/epimerase [Lederbergia lenta]SQI53805.1 xylose isomerase [Lederbergia lenta]
MKLGMSSYSLFQAMHKGEMDILDVLDWVKEIGGEHLELVPMGYDFIETPELIGQVKEKAASLGLDLSNYAIGANFICDTDEKFEQEIERVKQHVDICHQLGVKFMRHDIANREANERTLDQFTKDLPKLVEACQRIADYAKDKGIVTSIENHGFYVQASDRVQAIVHQVNRENFRTTLDIGNFLCYDENPLTAVKNNLPIASVVHLKDFYYRQDKVNRFGGWFNTHFGNQLRGAIVGHGDLPMPEIIELIRESDFNGYVTIEFEGVEECRFGAKASFDYARNLLFS